ncbi:ribosomal protein L7/L12 [Clostridium felsineum]|uniref:ribosomal protein L7/L12 n=1 Tax=Clostridium felsineum TaxID=36839 RepID=UPI00214D3056|nr:ribosomal protein L7/L12 [Clostridium felsineum]MCR3760251.1 ribosomal protein L7/L12 [Clostridium felsineum]
MEYIIIGVIIVVLMLAIFIRVNGIKTEIKDINVRLMRDEKSIRGENLDLENNVHNVNHKFEENISMDVDYEIRELLKNGNKIQAIKRYRTITNTGLKEAKDYIDSLDIYGN